MKKKWTMLLVVMFALTSIVLTSCSDDDDDGDNLTTMNAADLVAYMDANVMTIDEVLTGWIKSAGAVNTIMTDGDDTNDYYIIDIRSEDAYNAGHIPSAVNSTLANVVTEAGNAGGKTIAVVCYSGQGACHAVVALRLSDYDDAFSIKWGMSGWHTNVMDDIVTDSVVVKYDSWSGNTAQLNHANWVAAPGLVDSISTGYAYPSVSYEGDSEAAIVKARVQAMLDGAFKGVLSANVLAAPTNYFINNYWDSKDVVQYGNIDGAYRIKSLDITLLDPSKDIVTYCWTGQTSSMITAYLNVIGYDALSLKFGSNSMIYDDLLGHKWAVPTVDLPLEVTP